MFSSNARFMAALSLFFSLPSNGANMLADAIVHTQLSTRADTQWNDSWQITTLAVTLGSSHARRPVIGSVESCFSIREFGRTYCGWRVETLFWGMTTLMILLVVCLSVSLSVERQSDRLAAAPVAQTPSNRKTPPQQDFPIMKIDSGQSVCY